MLLIFGIVAIVCLAIGITYYCLYNSADAKYINFDDEVVYFVFNLIGTILLIITVLAYTVIGIHYSTKMIADDKIALYEEENAKIEQQIVSIVENYKEYESDTFEKFKVDTTDALTLISLFPELKSDRLVAKQIEIYVENNQQIKELKADRLQYKVMAWWLYFGNE